MEFPKLRKSLYCGFEGEFRLATMIGQCHYHAQSLKVRNSGGPLDNQTWQTNIWPQQKLPKFGFRTHTTALWPME